MHAALSVSDAMDFTDMYSPSFVSPFSSVTLTKLTIFIIILQVRKWVKKC